MSLEKAQFDALIRLSLPPSCDKILHLMQAVFAKF